MKIQVLNLDRTTIEADVFDLFQEFGDVNEVELSFYVEHGRDSQLAIVDMEDDMDAKDAIKELNGELFDGRIIQVKEMKAEKVNIAEEDEVWEEEWEGDTSEKILRKKPRDEEWEPSSKPKKKPR